MPVRREDKIPPTRVETFRNFYAYGSPDDEPSNLPVQPPNDVPEVVSFRDFPGVNLTPGPAGEPDPVATDPEPAPDPIDPPPPAPAPEAPASATPKEK